MTFAELEDECIGVGDLLSSAVLRKRVTERPPLRQQQPTRDRRGEPGPDEPPFHQEIDHIADFRRRAANPDYSWIIAPMT